MSERGSESKKVQTGATWRDLRASRVYSYASWRGGMRQEGDGEGGSGRAVTGEACHVVGGRGRVSAAEGLFSSPGGIAGPRVLGGGTD